GPSRTVSWYPSTYQPEYEPIESTRPRASEARVEVWTVDIGTKALAKERREAEGKIVAETVRRMVETEKTVGYGDITVLLRAFTHLTDYLRPLREADIPFVVDGGREFLKRPEVGHLLVVLKTLARPADPVALVAFLRSPVGAVPDAELAAYAAEHGSWRWSATVDAEKFPDIARAFATLRDLAARTKQAPADEVVRRVLDETNLLTVSAAAFEGPQRVANLEKLGAAAAELARDGRLSLIEVIEALEQGRTSTAESDSPLADEEIDAVNVMTIHKSKGLENDVVIIPDLARGDFWLPPGGNVRVARLADGTQALAVKAGNACNLGWVRVEWEGSLHEEAEETRVLYVGMTRARERLILLAAPSRTKSSWVEALRAWGYVINKDKTVDDLELLDGRVDHTKRREPKIESTGVDAVAEGAAKAVTAYNDAIDRLIRAGKPLRAPSDEEEWRDPGDEDRGQQGLRRAVSKDRARAVGVVLHRLLENWDGGDDDTLRSNVVRVAREVAGAAGLDPAAVEVETGEILDGFLGSELGKRLREIEVLGRETPMALSTEDGRCYRGTIDLIYRDADGEIVVADYKTDLEKDPSVLRERYGGQLAIYAEAVRRALHLGAPPKTELWHLRTTTRLPL
ncbi:MAG: 3'-5' exonuclease, partial [Acidobacteriota bacterium]|nr:3'-5' exonuclease [Acidobacteriota bacterium]